MNEFVLTKDTLLILSQLYFGLGHIEPAEELEI